MCIQAVKKTRKKAINRMSGERSMVEPKRRSRWAGKSKSEVRVRGRSSYPGTLRETKEWLEGDTRKEGTN